MKKFFTFTLLATLMTSCISFLNAEEITCRKCKGSGRIAISRAIRCRACNGVKKICSICRGHGQIYTPATPGIFGMPATSSVCVSCLGSGKATCWTCYDTGKEYLNDFATCPQCDGQGSFEL